MVKYVRDEAEKSGKKIERISLVSSDSDGWCEGIAHNDDGMEHDVNQVNFIESLLKNIYSAADDIKVTWSSSTTWNEWKKLLATLFYRRLEIRKKVISMSKYVNARRRRSYDNWTMSCRMMIFFYFSMNKKF